MADFAQTLNLIKLYRRFDKMQRIPSDLADWNAMVAVAKTRLKQWRMDQSQNE